MEWWISFIISAVSIVIISVILKLSSIYLYASVTLASMVGALVLLILRPYTVSECVYVPQPGDMIETITACIIILNIVIFVIYTGLRSNPRNRVCACCLKDKEFYTPGLFNDIDDVYSDTSSLV